MTSESKTGETGVNDVVSLELIGPVGLVAIDNPPVNALGQAVRAGLAAAMAEAAADNDIKAVVICCEGRTFFAGADITEFGKSTLRDRIIATCKWHGRRHRWCICLDTCVRGVLFERKAIDDKSDTHHDQNAHERDQSLNYTHRISN